MVDWKSRHISVNAANEAGKFILIAVEHCDGSGQIRVLESSKLVGVRTVATGTDVREHFLRVDGSPCRIIYLVWFILVNAMYTATLKSLSANAKSSPPRAPYDTMDSVIGGLQPATRTQGVVNQTEHLSICVLTEFR